MWRAEGMVDHSGSTAWVVNCVGIAMGYDRYMQNKSAINTVANSISTNTNTVKSLSSDVTTLTSK
jgi:hypothetical protein